MVYIKYVQPPFTRDDIDSSNFEMKLFRNNNHIQVLALKKPAFYGSLIYVKSEVPEVRFTFR